MVLTSPLMLVGLAALPALAAIYWLRSRSRRAVVSSLIFWADPRQPRHGGRIIQRMQTPLTFFLELLAIAMLVAAAAGPAMVKRELVRPLVVVLDDSYSMLAHPNGDKDDTACRRALDAVAEELGQGNYIARLILAGPQPRLLGQSVRTADQARGELQAWTCQNAAADLSAAMALAAEVGGRTARILVVTDHALPPQMKLDGGQVQWWAFGGNLPNVAFTAATRTRSGDNERVLLEVANLSLDSSSTVVTLTGGNLAGAKTMPVSLGGGDAKQFFLNLPAGAPPLRATLGNDTLEIDNEVTLLPGATKPLRVLVDVAEERLRGSVLRALEATGDIIAGTERPELIVSDKPGTMDDDAWRLEIVADKDSVAYAGPFVIDHGHPLSQGLSLQSTIWSAASKPQLSGLPIITAGNVPLLTDARDIAGRHRVQMNFAADVSNLQDMPDWPILFANFVRWRRGGLPGVARPNVRLGESVSVALAFDAKQVEITSPGSPPRKLDLRGRRLDVLADRVGQHEIRTANEQYAFSCNALSRDESDLRDCSSGRFGNWNTSDVHQDQQASLSWIFLVTALLAMAAHMAVIARSAEGRPT